MLTAKQAARLACVSVSLIYAVCREGRLRHLRVGRTGRRGAIRIAEADLAGFLKECEHAGAAEEEGPLRHIR